MAPRRLLVQLRPLRRQIQDHWISRTQPTSSRAISTTTKTSNAPEKAQQPNPTSPPPSPSPIPNSTKASKPTYPPPRTTPPTPEALAAFDPIAQSRARTTPLPPSRYHFRSPKYYRGPLHPHQPPPPWDPSSRVFIPGPFTLPRHHQTYTSTIRADLMTLTYTHVPPGTPTLPTPPRLRSWGTSNPYFANRPLRGPRGRPHLLLLHKPITFRNVPTLQRITVSALVREAQENSAHLHVAGMVLQAMTGVRATVHLARRGMSGYRTSFHQRAGKPVAVSCGMEGGEMWDFWGKLGELVLPGIKEWKGMRGSSGDLSGNLGLALGKEEVAGWPEVGVNYDAYPAHMIPSVHIILHTTATNDRDARLLVSALGMPFHGLHHKG